jgi:hypothetical protein
VAVGGLGRARAVALDPRVGGGQQAVEPGPALVRVEVERDAALVGVADREPEAGPVGRERRQPPGRRAAGGLHPHDVGAEVGEDPPAQLAPLVAGVDHADPGQRCAVLPCHLASPSLVRRK